MLLLLFLLLQLFVCSLWADKHASPIESSSIRETKTISPIFREVNSQDELTTTTSGELFLQDTRNWVPDNLNNQAIEDLFDTSAQIELDMGNREFVEQELATIASGKSPLAGLPEDERKRYELLLALNLAQARMMATIEPYRTTNLPDMATSNEKPAIRLGNLAINLQEPLGANINNYAPDNFVDADVMRLFEMHREVRDRLASDAATGECSLHIDQLRALNREVRESFKRSMLDYAAANEHNGEDLLEPNSQSLERRMANGEEDECEICRESLSSKPAAQLPCRHVYHRACLASWARAQDSPVSTCPACRQIFRLPYRMVEKLF